MEIDEIPTPETDTLYNPENGWTGVVPIDHARRLERRLALLTEHVGLCHDEIGESRDSDTSDLHLFFRREVANDKKRIIDAVIIIDLERRLTIEKNRAEEMGELAYVNACEAMKYCRLLTIAREALKKLDNWLMRDAQRKQIIKEALTLTTPKP